MKDNKNLDQVMELLQNGVKDVFTSEKYRNYLTMLSKFHDYSYNNVLYRIQKQLLLPGIMTG